MGAARFNRFNKITIQSMDVIFLSDMSVLFVNIVTLLALTQSVENMFYSFVFSFKNEYFFVSSLQFVFTNAVLCPLRLQCVIKFEEGISSNIFIAVQYKKTSVWSPFSPLVSNVLHN